MFASGFSKKDILAIADLFEQNYGELGSFLNFHTAFQLLIAVVLSAQCTDKRVNIITNTLFQHYTEPSDLAKESILHFEKQINTCNMYHNKAKYLIETSKILVERFNGVIPQDFNALVSLPGIGRKSANVILGTCFNEQRLPVDTHVLRVSNRIGIAQSKTPERTEEDLSVTVPQNLWMKFHRWLIKHGRTYCTAGNPKCADCFLNGYCLYALKCDINHKS